eukprot:TRINITY_DN6513_c0_g1_i1.p1 TRINITY_DN6513_c0_g1~~TRINITY_DN6513_c0_g1_i1.p1  ORF type:complete len:364 (+),score=73.67 TRINITY_DN6513_c0_g1_i1:170-1261(+)
MPLTSVLAVVRIGRLGSDLAHCHAFLSAHADELASLHVVLLPEREEKYSVEAWEAILAHSYTHCLLELSPVEVVFMPAAHECAAHCNGQPCSPEEQCMMCRVLSHWCASHDNVLALRSRQQQGADVQHDKSCLADLFFAIAQQSDAAVLHHNEPSTSDAAPVQGTAPGLSGASQHHALAPPFALNAAHTVPFSFAGSVVGGTFDRLHAGHCLLLTVASLLAAAYIEVGVRAGDILKNKHLTSLILPYAERAERVRHFLSVVRPFATEVDIFPLTDPWGRLRHSTKIHAIAITEENTGALQKVNAIRAHAALPPLHIVYVRFLPSTLREGEKVSSSILRQVASSADASPAHTTAERKPPPTGAS